MPARQVHSGVPVPVLQVQVGVDGAEVRDRLRLAVLTRHVQAGLAVLGEKENEC